MKKFKQIICITIACLLAINLVACGNKVANTESDTNSLVNVPLSDDILENSKLFMGYFKDGKNPEIFAMTSKAFKDKVDESTLLKQNEALKKQLGSIKEYDNFRVKEEKNITFVLVHTLFEKGEFDLKIVFNNENKTVEGYFLNPPDKTSQGDIAIDTEFFKGEEVTFGTNPYKAKGTLLLPKNSNNPPVVILVHGSGPSDRDETINGVNKPFKDIAEGLAKKGIAVLRYAKRTYAYSGNLTEEQIINATPEFETIEDAVNGIKYLKTRNDIDKSKIYVLGHSLGGYLLPAINNSDEPFTGGISLAGTINVPFEDLMSYQYNYLANVDGTITEDEKSALDQMKSQIDLVKKLKRGETISEKLILGMGQPYWNYLNNYNQLAEISKIDKPILVLQGERDYQVPISNYNEFQNALKDKSNFIFKSYKNLNHLFMAGTGTPTPDEYNTPGHVSDEVISDIAIFINGQK